MSEHYTSLTVSAAAWCPKCQKQTQHRVDDKRKGPCLECIARLGKEIADRPAPVPDRQGKLFGKAS